MLSMVKYPSSYFVSQNTSMNNLSLFSFLFLTITDCMAFSLSPFLCVQSHIFNICFTAWFDLSCLLQFYRKPPKLWRKFLPPLWIWYWWFRLIAQMMILLIELFCYPFFEWANWWGFLTLAGSSNKPKLGIIIGVVGGLIGLLFFGGLLYFICKRRHKGYKREIFVDVAGMSCFLVIKLIKFWPINGTLI